MSLHNLWISRRECSSKYQFYFTRFGKEYLWTLVEWRDINKFLAAVYKLRETIRCLWKSIWHKYVFIGTVRNMWTRPWPSGHISRCPWAGRARKASLPAYTWGKSSVKQHQRLSTWSPSPLPWRVTFMKSLRCRARSTCSTTVAIRAHTAKWAHSMQKPQYPFHARTALTSAAHTTAMQGSIGYWRAQWLYGIIVKAGLSAVFKY